MSHQSVAALARTLRGHIGLGKSRLETLCMLVVGMVGARTVNLTHVASAGARGVQIASTYRRLQRFFQHVDLGPDWAVTIVARLIDRSGDWTLALDRTTWKIGARDVNYLVLAVVTRRFRVPLFWTLLDGRGNSGTAARIALMKRYLAHFPASSVRILLADREFIGAEWLKYLNDNNINFAIRLREDLRVTCDGGFDLTLLARLNRAGRTRFFQARIGTREDAAANDAPRLHFAAKRLKGEWLIVVSNIPGPKALALYPKRWAIECLFGDAKTRGLNIEDTRLTDPRKLAPHGPRRPRHRLGRPRRRRSDGTRRPQTQAPRIPRAVLVPRRLRQAAEPSRLRPGGRSRTLAKAHQSNTKSNPCRRSRVV